MPSIAKSEIVKAVAERTSLPVAQVEKVVQGLLDQMVKELARGRKVVFSKYLSLSTRVRRPRTARNPRTGATVNVPAQTKVVFSAGSRLRQLVEAKLPSAIFYGTGGASVAKSVGSLKIDASELLGALDHLEKKPGSAPSPTSASPPPRPASPPPQPASPAEKPASPPVEPGAAGKT